ncbi:MAG TPA: hypothetical protein ENK06_00695, partial [Gammaproteobacteria bacterium]|nr:hypothetical protein [Gammaproteobacteria bacterium]
MNRLLKNHPNRMCMGKILLFFIILPLIQPAFAWKPITHVYLGKEALDEVDVNYNIPFFEVDYENKQKLDLIDRFEGNQELIDLLRRESDSFYAGILGPDAYPDLPTGQTRIHVACPDGAVELDKSNNYCPANTLHNHQLITDDWLRYIWNNAQNSGQDDVKAFAFGFMVHAAGDMYMHTFVNYFAGGEFSTFSDNGLRHTVIESYVGKRTPALFQNGDEYDIELTSNVSKFIYDFLVNATPDSDLNNKLLVELPLDYTLDNLYTTVSVPRHFSTLRNALNVRIKQYDDKVKAFKDELSPLVDALSDCVDRAIDKTPLNNCNPLSMADLSLKIGAKQLLKDAYVLPRFVFIAYIKNWVNDINEGLAAWPAFSHDVGKILLFNKENQFDKEALAERWEEYRNAHFVKMMGGTVIASTVLTQYNELMDQLYPEAIMEIVENMKTAGRNAFLDIIIRAFTLNQLTREYFVRLINSPEFEINSLINNP